MDYKTVAAGWNSDRRCGYRFYSGYWTMDDDWRYYFGTTNGGHNGYNIPSEQRCNCPLKYGPYTSINTINTYTNVYTAICLETDWIDSFIWTNPSAVAWIKSQTCPKGWGKSGYNGTNKNYVQNAQGYVVSSYQEPIYDYVTRYRDVYYNYITSRVAKS